MINSKSTVFLARPRRGDALRPEKGQGRRRRGKEAAGGSKAEERKHIVMEYRFADQIVHLNFVKKAVQNFLPCQKRRGAARTLSATFVMEKEKPFFCVPSLASNQIFCQL